MDRRDTHTEVHERPERRLLLSPSRSVRQVVSGESFLSGHFFHPVEFLGYLYGWI